MKKIFISLFLLIIAAFPLKNIVFAQTSPATANPTTANTATNGSQTAQANKITNLKTRADTEITRRINQLNIINIRLGTIKHLTDAQKSAFSSQISTEIANLKTLETKIDADTDLPTLKTDVQSIVTSYRVFALFIPQIQMIGAADRILNVADMMNDLAAKLAKRINDAKNAGHSAANLQTILTDMQNKIADAKTQANNVISSVAGLTPAGYPGNKSTLQSARAMLQTARQDLVAAGQDAKQIIQGLRAFKSTTTTVSITPTGITPAPTH